MVFEKVYPERLIPGEIDKVKFSNIEEKVTGKLRSVYL